MNGVVGLDVLGDESNEFSHNRLDPRRVPRRVRHTQENPVEPFVVGAHPKPLTG